MKRLFTYFMPAASLLTVPAVVAAQTMVDPDNQLLGFIESITIFINDVIVPLIFAIAFVVFLYGVFKYFIAEQGDSADRKRAQDLMLYGILGFVIMVSVWGIVNLLASGLGLTSSFDSGLLPETPGPGAGGAG